MKSKIAVLAVCLAVAAVAEAATPQRIVGGEVTSIDQYPYAVSMLHNQQGMTLYTQWCAGSILTSRTVLSAAHCYTRNDGTPHANSWWLIRAGSSYANSGGAIYNVRQFIRHPQYSSFMGSDNDIVVIQSETAIAFGVAQPASISGPNYVLPDNTEVWAIGWGAVRSGGLSSEELRHVQVWTINRDICRERYSTSMVTENMICSGWLDVGGRDQCQGDSGGPLIHNGVIVGLSSWGWDCASPVWPGVNTRVSSYTDWVVDTANTLTNV